MWGLLKMLMVDHLVVTSACSAMCLHFWKSQVKIPAVTAACSFSNLKKRNRERRTIRAVQWDKRGWVDGYLFRMNKQKSQWWVTNNYNTPQDKVKKNTAINSNGMLLLQCMLQCKTCKLFALLCMSVGSYLVLILLIHLCFPALGMHCLIYVFMHVTSTTVPNNIFKIIVGSFCSFWDLFRFIPAGLSRGRWLHFIIDRMWYP